MFLPFVALLPRKEQYKNKTKLCFFRFPPSLSPEIGTRFDTGGGAVKRRILNSYIKF